MTLLIHTSSPDVAPHQSPEDILASDMIRFAADQALLWRVLASSTKDVRQARAGRGGSAVLDNTAVREEIETALKLAVPRAWMNRFLADQGIDEQTFFSKHGDRDGDYGRLNDHFPEFGGFVPSPAITREEVLRAARTEVRRVLNGKGSDTHQNRLYNRYKEGPFRPGTLRRKPEMGALTDTVLVGNLDHRTDLPVTTQDPFAPQNDAVFNETVMRCAAHLLPLFGMQWTWYWVWEKQFFPGEMTQMLRVVGFADIEREDPKRFNSIRMDFLRRLKEMDEELKHFASDARMRDRYDAMSGAA